MLNSKLKNIPNIITYVRLITSFFFPIFIFYFSPLNYMFINFSLSTLFIFFSLTDFLDGYIARKYNIETLFGKALDPIADKFFIIFPLISLVAINKIFFLWVIIFVGRELFIMGLRQVALENNFNINVSFLGKIKTFCQIIMIAFIIVNPDNNKLYIFSKWNIIELILILSTLLLSLLSAYQYFRLFKLKY